MTIHFADILVTRPTRESLAAHYAELEGRLDLGGYGVRRDVVAAWDRLRREIAAWHAMVELRFEQDTRDPEIKADRDYADALMPEATRLETGLKRRLLGDPDRAGLEALVGHHAVRLWESDVTTFDPIITGDLEREAKLGAAYTEILAGARINIDGRSVNLAGLEPYAQDLDRATRFEAERLRWEFFAAHGEALDAIYDDLVKLRHGMAVKLGYESYIPLAYKRMRRVDYGPEEVAAYRDQVAEYVVPLVARLIDDRKAGLGLEVIKAWDEAIVDPAGNPGPAGGHDFLVDRARAMFARMDPSLAGFYALMADGGFLDLANRDGKAGGGFCTAFPTHGVPFIFANFNGTEHDVKVFTHEMGHAFQCWESRNQPGLDYLWPTMESAEINSMGLEFLAHPHLDLLVAPEEVDRFRRVHLEESLAFLPYGVCVDHFQHAVYARPEATPAERHAMWQALERRYLPWRDWGDLAYPAKGGLWQAKRHIYLSPFYYIDYTLALCCALQFWARSLEDYQGALDAYVALCGRGGSAPFQDLVRSAGLVSPFAPGALKGVVEAAAARLRV
jgi:M3 family oligoendopeptidase